MAAGKEGVDLREPSAEVVGLCMEMQAHRWLAGRNGLFLNDIVHMT